MTDDTIEPAPVATVPHRRRFFGAVGALSAAAVLAACGDDDDQGAQETTSTTAGDDTTTTSEAGGSGDVAIAEFAASLEALAVNTYAAGIEAANAGDLGPVPPAVAEFAVTAQANHQAHLDAWNDVITSNGGEEVAAPPPELEEMINGRFAEVSDVAGLAMLALDLERIAADTYLSVLPQLSAAESIKLAGSIQAVDRQHQSILLFALGQYPVPEVFQTTEQAVAPG